MDASVFQLKELMVAISTGWLAEVDNISRELGEAVVDRSSHGAPTSGSGSHDDTNSPPE